MAAKNKQRKKGKSTNKVTFQTNGDEFQSENIDGEEGESLAEDRGGDKAQDNGEELDLEEVLRLGGTQADYVLLATLDDSNELVDGGKKGAIDDLEEGELEKFITKLGIRAYATQQIVKDEPEDAPSTAASTSAAPQNVEKESQQAKVKKTADQVKKTNDASVSSGKKKAKQNVFEFYPRNVLLVKPGGKWFEVECASEGSDSPQDPSLVSQYKTLAQQLYEAEVSLFKTKKTLQKGANTGWMKTVVSSGVLADRMAAMTLLIQDAPVHMLEQVENLVAMVKKRGSRRMGLMAMDTLRELLLSNLLPENRKLRQFAQRPFDQLEERASGNRDARDRRLVLWYFEHQLKNHVADFVEALDSVAHDTVAATKTKALATAHELLCGRPEQERALLMQVVNKLGDPEYKTAAKASYLLETLLHKHPNMKVVVCCEVERLMFRPNVSPKAQYYSICFLSQVMLSHDEAELAAKLITIYFSFFRACVKKKDVDSKMLSALLSGVNRAYPYASAGDEKVKEQMDTLFKVVHLVKLAGSTSPSENMRSTDRDAISSSDPEVDDEAEELIRGSDSEDRRNSRVRLGIRGELGNVLLLLFLYVLQGIPLGLAGSIPLILQSKSVSYRDQAFFSFVFWPFSLKLLWAPLVDALYCSRFGRRKSWLVPTQYLLGLFMICLSVTVDSLLQNEDGPDIVVITAVFFMLAFLAATQDIAVDGWALTMLSRENVGYASTCNSVGQTAGYFLGNVLFLALESANFCNKYLRREPKDTGIVTLSDFLFFWGIVFLVSTTLVAVFKRENVLAKGKRKVPEETQGVTETYKLLFSIIKMPTVFTFCSLLLTAKVGFSAADAVTGLKLVEAGVPKEQLALLAVPMVPLQILLPVVISRYTAGPRPLDVFYKAFPFRLLIGLGYALLVWWTPSVKQDGGFPLYYYAIVLLSYAVHQVALYSMYVACMAFHAKVSDPLIGGTYMTLLNTVTNLGGNWPSTVALWLVDPLTSKECQGPAGQSCSSPAEAALCAKEGGTCLTTLDGYYVESVVCVLIGLVWWLWLGKKMRRLQEQNPAAWRCRLNQ